jgi:hypothetical protein
VKSHAVAQTIQEQNFSLVKDAAKRARRSCRVRCRSPVPTPTLPVDRFPKAAVWVQLARFVALKVGALR